MTCVGLLGSIMGLFIFMSESLIGIYGALKIWFGDGAAIDMHAIPLDYKIKVAIIL